MLTSPYYTKAVNEMRSAIENNDVSLFDKLLNVFRSNIQIATELEINATEELMNTPKFVVNNLELSKLFGSRGKAMAFKPANERKGNPNYSKCEAYKNNCQSCVLANELRRRGFDVEALPFGSQASLKLARHTELAFLDKGGNINDAFNASFSCYNPVNGYECWQCKPCFRKFIAFALNGYSFDSNIENAVLKYIINEIYPQIKAGIYGRADEEKEIVQLLQMYNKI